PPATYTLSLHDALPIFGQCPVDPEIRALFRRRIVAMRHLFRSCEEVKFDFGEADSCFDVVRAQNFVERYQAIYQKDPNSLGPNRSEEHTSELQSRENLV